MGDLSTYSLADFFPLSGEVYFRLFVRLNEAVWPAHLLAVALGACALYFAVRGRDRATALPLAVCWIFAGWQYFLNYYAELNWAATYAGWCFILQGIVVGGAGWSEHFSADADAARPFDGPRYAGLGLALVGLVALPFVEPAAGRAWTGLQVFGIAPNPTVVATLGIFAILERCPWWLYLVPLSWCIVAGAEGWVLGSPTAAATAAAGLAALGVATWRLATR